MLSSQATPSSAVTTAASAPRLQPLRDLRALFSHALPGVFLGMGHGRGDGAGWSSHTASSGLLSTATSWPRAP
jgi:hypothetical protein